jgi:hypothetical protein
MLGETGGGGGFNAWGFYGNASLLFHITKCLPAKDFFPRWPRQDWGFSGALPAGKPMRLEALLPQAAVKRTDKKLVRGVARPGPIQNHAIRISQPVNLLRYDLRAVVHPNPPGHPVVGHGQVEGRRLPPIRIPAPSRD